MCDLQFKQSLNHILSDKSDDPTEEIPVANDQKPLTKREQQMAEALAALGQDPTSLMAGIPVDDKSSKPESALARPKDDKTKAPTDVSPTDAEIPLTDKDVKPIPTKDQDKL